MLVEDNEVNRYLARFLLEHGGFAVVTANNGMEALEQARAHKPDLILMDIQMPVMDGYEATRALKADPALQSVPVVALTAYAMPHEREQALAAGCVGHIEKPIDTQHLHRDAAHVSPVPPGANPVGALDERFRRRARATQAPGYKRSSDSAAALRSSGCKRRCQAVGSLPASKCCAARMPQRAQRSACGTSAAATTSRQCAGASPSVHWPRPRPKCATAR